MECYFYGSDLSGYRRCQYLSALSGAAANSAALAWLGGGALAAGGGGMSAGTAFLG